MKTRITRVVVLSPGQFVVRSFRDMFTDTISVNDGELRGEQFHLSSWDFDDSTPLTIIEEKDRLGRVLRTFHQGNRVDVESTELTITIVTKRS